MLKSILNLSNARQLSKKEQKLIKGGDSFMCLVMCGPGDGNTPIYDYNYYPLGTPLGDAMIPVEVGCACA